MVDGEGKHKVVALLDNSVWISRHIVDVMIMARNMIVFLMPRPHFGNV